MIPVSNDVLLVPLRSASPGISISHEVDPSATLESIEDCSDDCATPAKAPPNAFCVAYVSVPNWSWRELTRCT